MQATLDLAGRKFGLWRVIHREADVAGKRYWLCRCECGVERNVLAESLRAGKSTNCGCVRRKKVAARNYKHGMGETKLHARWLGMLARCYDKSHKGYPGYGGRGIRVCARWRRSFQAFLDDMGMPPTPQHKIERKDNDGDYTPENCCWVTNKENCQNTRQNFRIVHNGESLTSSQWSERTGIKAKTIYSRIVVLGWSVARALTTPTLTFSEAAKLQGKVKR